MHIEHANQRNFFLTVLWSLMLSAAIVAAAAALGRATANVKAALTDKPDIAIYLLMEDANLGRTTLLRESETERAYLAESGSGPLLVTLKRGPTQWFVASKEFLHE
jgi:hypothetical protein